MRDKILITGDFDIPAEYMADNVVHLRVPRNNEDIVDHLDEVKHYIVGGPEYVDDHIMSCVSDLKHVVVMGTGISSFIDVATAQSRGIAVDNTPAINADAVAEFALGMMIVNLANCFFSQQDLLAGGWYQKPHKTLSDTKLGIVGLGNIGSKLAAKVRAISSAEIFYFSRTPKPDLESKYGLEFMSLKNMVSECEAISLCVTYTPDTHHMMNAGLLQTANPNLILLNFSNPLIIDPIALRESLATEQIRFAFFDGYYNEWIHNQGQQKDEYALLGLGPEKFVATSHIAAQSQGVIAKILKEAFVKITQWNEAHHIPVRKVNSGSLRPSQPDGLDS